MHMFCFQCQETRDGKACTSDGACGKSEETANLQDLLIHLLKGIGLLSTATPNLPIEREVGEFLYNALYATVTNTNFDAERFTALINRALQYHELLRSHAAPDQLAQLTADCVRWPTELPVDASRAQVIHAKAYTVGVLLTKDEDLRSLREMIMYSLKGIASCAGRAVLLGNYEASITQFMLRALAATASERSFDQLFELAIETGQVAMSAMGLLDRAHAAAYGFPEKTAVLNGVRRRPGILVSGHDLRDLEDLLVQTEGQEVDVYTHGEMISAHYFPKLKAFAHLAGNYGHAWWKQEEEFAAFNGPILMTTNCITPVAPAYRDRIFTTGMAGYPEIPHLKKRREDGRKDFGPIIERAKRCAPPTPTPKSMTEAFVHSQLRPVTDTLLELVRTGAIRRFVVIGGCDVRDRLGDYYREIALRLPRDTVILTAGCTKYMFSKLALGEIAGIPRVLDAGQCNDYYSLVAFAMKLRRAIGATRAEDLPLSLNVSWYDQKAVAVFLALMFMGIQRVRLGPSLPAFWSPRVAAIFKDRYQVRTIGAPEEDVAAMMRGE